MRSFSYIRFVEFLFHELENMFHHRRLDIIQPMQYMSYVVAEMMISETINVIVCQIRFGSIFGRGAHTNTLIYIVYNEQNTDMSIKYRL